MKRAILFLIVSIGFIGSGHAQTKADTVLQSLLPIRWSFSFIADCHGQHDTVVPALWDDSLVSNQLSWADSISPWDTITTSWSGSILNAQVKGLEYNVPYFQSQWIWDLSIDTGIKKILELSFDWTGVAPLSGEFDVGKTDYKKSDSGKFEAIANQDSGAALNDWSGSTLEGCFGEHPSQITGWVSFGGISPPAKVADSHSPEDKRITAVQLPDHVIRFFFSNYSERGLLRFFDLMGRERDRIIVPLGSQSFDYRLTSLTPGMYFATLDGSAVKFIVP